MKPNTVQLFSTQQKKNPLSMMLHSTNITDLAIEAMQCVKLIAMEERDLTAIRLDHKLKSEYLEKTHLEIMKSLEQTFHERSQYIELIRENSRLLIEAGQHEAAQAIMFRLGDFLAGESPLNTALEYKRNKG